LENKLVAVLKPDNITYMITPLLFLDNRYSFKYNDEILKVSQLLNYYELKFKKEKTDILGEKIYYVYENVSKGN